MRVPDRRASASRWRSCRSRCGCRTSTRARRRRSRPSSRVGSKAAAFAVVLRIFFEALGADVPQRRLVDDLRRPRRRLDDRRQRDGPRPDEHQAPARLQLDRAGRQLPGRPRRDLRRRRRVHARRQRRAVLPRDVRLHEPRRLHRHHRDLADGPAATRSPTTPACGSARRSSRSRSPSACVSLTGIPPTAGFFAKLYIFNAAIQADLVWLVVIAVLNSVISAFYYLRRRAPDVPRRARRREADQAPHRRSAWPSGRRRWACSSSASSRCP